MDKEALLNILGQGVKPNYSPNAPVNPSLLNLPGPAPNQQFAPMDIPTEPDLDPYELLMALQGASPALKHYTPGQRTSDNAYQMKTKFWNVIKSEFLGKRTGDNK